MSANLVRIDCLLKPWIILQYNFRLRHQNLCRGRYFDNSKSRLLELISCFDSKLKYRARNVVHNKQIALRSVTVICILDNLFDY